MAKTINPQIDIFEKETSAVRAFNKSTVPCQLLSSLFAGKTVWFLDRSKQAILDWPEHYKLVSEK